MKPLYYYIIFSLSFLTFADAAEEDSKNNLEVAKLHVQGKIEHYSEILTKLEAEDGKIPQTLKDHYRNYKIAYEELFKELSEGHNINLQDKLDSIERNNNTFYRQYIY